MLCLRYRVDTARTQIQRTTDARRSATASAPVRCAALQLCPRRRRSQFAQPPLSCSSQSVLAGRRHQSSSARHQTGAHTVDLDAHPVRRAVLACQTMGHVPRGYALCGHQRYRVQCQTGFADAVRSRCVGSAACDSRGVSMCCAAMRRPPERRRTGSGSTSAARRSGATAAPPPLTTMRLPARSTAGEPAADRTPCVLHPRCVAVCACAGLIQLLVAHVFHPRAGTSCSQGHFTRI
jgi:hypothetical protein